MRALKFGLSLDYLGRDASLAENFETLLVLVREAREAGFDLIYMGQHFLEGHYVRFQPLPMLSRLAAEAGDMLVVYADITSLNHPVRVAEDLATLDVITGGNAVLLSVLGYAPAEFDQFGVKRSERVPRVNETYEIVARLCSGETVDFEGDKFRVNDARLALLPPGYVRPPIWSTAHADRALGRVANYADVWFASHQPTLDELAEQVPMYRELKTNRNTAVLPFRDDGIELPLLRETFVAPTEAEALDAAEEPMMRVVRSYVELGQISALKDPQSYLAPFDTWRKNRALIGDPAEVTAELRRYQESIGLDCAVLKIYHEGIPLQRTVDSIRLIAREVIPRFR